MLKNKEQEGTCEPLLHKWTCACSKVKAMVHVGEERPYTRKCVVDANILYIFMKPSANAKIRTMCMLKIISSGTC